MADFSVSTSFELMRRTVPFVIFRVIVYTTIAVTYVLATGTGAGIGWGIGFLGDEEFRAGAVFFGGLAGFGLVAAVLYFLREYLLYLVKAGHVAVMIEYLEGRDLPAGKGQITYAQEIVKARFAESSVLFVLDQLVRGVIRTITGLLEGIASLFNLPVIGGLVRVLRAFLKVAVGLIDEVILGHILRLRAENPWAAARDALVLYGQNGKAMMMNAALIALITWGLSFVVFLVMLAPAGAVVWMIPGAWSAGGLVFALLFAWAVKAALIEPFATACLLQVFFRVTDGQVPNPDWTARLDSASARFGKLGEKARGWVGARAG